MKTFILLALLAIAKSSKGDDPGSLGPCSEALGMESGTIKDDAILAVSTYGNDSDTFGAQRARLNLHLSGYRAESKAHLTTKEEPWLFIKLGDRTVITGIATQGFGNASEWVSAYTLMYSDGDDQYLNFMKRNGSVEIFTGNNDSNTIVYNRLSVPAIAKTVLIKPRSWHTNIGLRMEIYGCKPKYYFMVWLNISSDVFDAFTSTLLNSSGVTYKALELDTLNELNAILGTTPGFLEAELTRFSPEQAASHLRVKAEIIIWWISDAVGNLTKRLKSHQVQSVFDFKHMKIFYPKNSACPFPSVNLDLHHTWDHATEVTTTDMPVFTATIKQCNASLRFTSILWEFSIISNEDDSFSEFLPLSEYNRTNISVNMYNITRHFTVYPVNLYLRFSAEIENQKWSDFGLLRILQLPLRAIINGTTHAVKGVGFINLNGSESCDPETGNNDGMQFNWTCRKDNESCDDIIVWPDLEAKDIRVNVNMMESRSSYMFILTVTSRNRMSKVSHELRIQAFGFTLSCKRNCHGKASPSRSIIIQSNCNGLLCHDKPEYQWSLHERETRNGEMFWIETNRKQTLEPFLGDSQLKIKTLLLMRNNQKRNPVYKVKANATIRVKDGFVKEKAELTFVVNSPPGVDDDVDGCHIEPKEGTAITTNFTVTCLGWKDNDKPLRFEFRYREGFTIIQAGRSNRLTTILPIGNHGKNFSFTLQIDVIDSLGDCANTTVEAKVKFGKGASDILEKIIKKEENLFNNLLESGQTADAFRLAIAVLSLLKENADAENISGGYSVTKDNAVKLKQNIIDSMVNVTILSLEEVTQLCGIITIATEDPDDISQDHQETAVNKLMEVVDLVASLFVNSTTEKIKIVGHDLLQSLGNIVSISSSNADVSRSGNNSVQEKGLSITHKIIEALRKFRKNINVTNADEEPLHISSKYVDMIVYKPMMRHSYPQMDFVFPNFRLQENEIDPTGVISKIILFKKNPFTWHSSANLIKSQVLDIVVESANRSLLDQFVKRPVDLFIPRESTRNLNDRRSTKQYFVKPSEHWLDTEHIQHHQFSIPLGQSAAFAIIKPQGRHQLRIYAGNVVTIIPKNLSSCANSTSVNADSLDCDPYTVRIPSDNRNGPYTMGIQYLKEETTSDNAADNVRSTNLNIKRKRVRRDCGSLSHLEKELCIKVKNPPTKPPRIIIPAYNASVDVNYTFWVSIGSCMYWSEGSDKWTNDGCKISMTNRTGHIHCQCSHLSAFGGDLFVQPNTINFRRVFDNFKGIVESGNYAVLTTVCSVLVLYFIGIILTRRADRKDRLKLIPKIHLMDGGMGNYHYQISVQTGLWRGSGTTANIGLVIYGENEYTDSISLNETESDKKYFSRGSVNSFVISLPQKLGHLYKIKIWHDNSGKNPSWYLQDVIITDLESKTSQHFIADRWLTVERGTGQIEAEIQAANEKELSRFKNLFITRVSKRLADGHLWISLFTRPPQSWFTRTQRLSCCLTVLFTTLVTNAMFCQFGERQQDAIQVGPLKLSWTQIKIGIQSALITLPLNVVIVTIFRNSRPCEDDHQDIDSSSSRGLSHAFVYLAWALCICSVGVSATFTIFYSLEWGAEISNEWLTSIVVSFIQDVIISQPILVIILACLLSLLFRKPLRHDRVRGVTHRHQTTGNEKPVIKPDKEELERSRKLRLDLLKVFSTSMRILAYFVFAVLLFVVCYGNRSTARFTVTKSLEDTFNSFSQVNTTAHFWNWSKNILLPGLYNSTWYNNKTFEYEEGFISTRNGFLVGMPRLRQVRLKTESNCARGGFIEAKKCLPSYNEQTEEKEQYNLPGWTPVTNVTKLLAEFELDELCPKPWRYQTAGHLGSLPFRGVFFKYGGGGFAADLGYNSMKALKTVQDLENNHWINEKTIALFVEFTIFEPSSALFSAVKYLLEMGPTGGPYKIRRIDTLVLYYPTNTMFRAFYQVCQLLFMLVICCFFVSEMRELHHLKWRYFREFWNWIELIQMINAVSAMVLFLFKARYTGNFVKRVRENPFQTSSTDYIVWWSHMELFLLSFVVFIVTVQFLRLFKFNKHICHLLGTLKSSFKDLLSFSFVFMAILMAYVQVGNLLFGSSAYNYSSIAKTLRILIERLLGKNMYTNEFHNQEYRIVGPLFVFSYSVTIAFILLNMFLGILNTSYLDVRKKHQMHFSAVELAEFTIDYFKSQIKHNQENIAEFFKTTRKKRREGKKYRAEDDQPLLVGSRAGVDELIYEVATFGDTDDIMYVQRRLDDVKSSLKEIVSDLSDVISVPSSLFSLQMKDREVLSSSEEENFGEGCILHDSRGSLFREDDYKIDLCGMDSSSAGSS